MNCCPNHALGHAFANTITHKTAANSKEQMIFSTTFALNSMLALLLLIGGFVCNFTPLIGEGLHQIEDSFLIILGIVATIFVGRQKNDINYTLGKGRDNIIWTLIASVLLIALEGNLFYEELSSLTEKSVSINGWSLVIISTSIFANIASAFICSKSKLHIGKFFTLHNVIDGGLGIFTLITAVLMLTGHTQWQGLNIEHLTTIVIAGCIIAFGITQAKQAREQLNGKTQDINRFIAFQRQVEKKAGEATKVSELHLGTEIIAIINAPTYRAEQNKEREVKEEQLAILAKTHGYSHILTTWKSFINTEEAVQHNVSLNEILHEQAEEEEARNLIETIPTNKGCLIKKQKNTLQLQTVDQTFLLPIPLIHGFSVDGLYTISGKHDTHIHVKKLLEQLNTDHLVNVISKEDQHNHKHPTMTTSTVS